MPLEFDGVNGIIKNTTSDGDITIKGNDDGSEISALVFDMSAAGAATFNDKITAVGTSVFTNLDISGDIDVDGTTNLDVVDIDGAVDMASTLTVTGAAILNGGIDVAGDFNFDVGGGDITFKDDGTSVVNFGLESGNFIVNATASDTDIIFKGNDGGSAITALTLDMSAAGAAAFNAGATFGGNLTVTVNDNSDTLTLTSTDADANVGPVLRLRRDSGSPADDDLVGAIHFSADDSNDSNLNIGSITTIVKDVTGGLVDGVLGINVIDNDTFREFVRFQGSVGSVFNENSADLDFRVESNGNANMLFVDAGNDRVGVGCEPSADFHVDSSGGGVIRVSRNSSSTSNFMALESDGTNGTVKAIQSLIVSAGGGEVARFTSGGLAIGGTGAANTLDDYEEGTWTPVISADAVPSAYASQVGVYTKVGRLVTVIFVINISTIGSFAGAATKITGFPFTSGDLSTHTFGTLFLDGTASAVQAAGDLGIKLSNNTSQALFQMNSGNTSGDNNVNANVIDTGTFIHGTITYFTG
jgi:hypothetical protein